jgi:hypothetical protein
MAEPAAPARVAIGPLGPHQRTTAVLSTGVREVGDTPDRVDRTVSH